MQILEECLKEAKGNLESAVEIVLLKNAQDENRKNAVVIQTRYSHIPNYLSLPIVSYI